MKRPTYETADDRYAENRAMMKLASHVGMGYQKLPKYDPFDFHLIKKDKAVAKVEVKVRSCTMDRYPTYMISQIKTNEARNFINQGWVCILLVQWADALGATRLGNEYATTKGGRLDRFDLKDIESVSLIPMSEFTVIA